MNKIDELIKELCPDGVEWKELGEVIDYEQPSKYIVKSTKYNDDYLIPVLTAGQTFILGFTNESDGVYESSKDRPVIIFDDFTTSFHWVDFSFKIKSSAMKILKLKTNKVDFKFIYYSMRCIKYIAQDHARQWISVYSKFSIPIPPLPIQQEIVAILDKFTQLEAELEAELEYRKKQYEYYRNKLLTPIEVNGKWMMNGIEVELNPLEKIITSLKTGLNPRKNFVLNPSNATNYYITVRELNGIDITLYDKTDKVDDEALILINNRSNLEKGDVLFSGTGTIGRTALVKEKPTNWNIKEGVYTIKPVKSKILSKFLIFTLNSQYTKKQVNDKTVGSPVCSIPMTELKKIFIPLPPLEEQERIVAILDKFDTLVNDISIGLPAEIDVRRKQYEYYREKLLTFRNISENN